MTGGIVLEIGLCFHDHAPEQAVVDLALHQPAAHQVRRNNLRWTAEEDLGKCWEIMVAIGLDWWMRKNWNKPYSEEKISMKMNTKEKVKHLLKSFIPEIARKPAKSTLFAAREILLFPSTAKSLIDQSQNLRKRYPSIQSAEALANKHTPELTSTTKTLDLGCGTSIRNPFGANETSGVDIRNGLSHNIKRADLSAEEIPYDSNFFDFCTAFDFLEHIPRISWASGKSRLAFIELMNEIHRVLKPNGLFLHATPTFPSKQAFQDPTHVNIMTEDTIPLYFCEPNNWAKTIDYGFHGSFELIEQRWIDNIWVSGILRAIK